MKGFSFLAVVVACFLGQNSCSGRVALNPFPFGTIGCLVSDVCGSGEVCINDLLFGSCQNIFTRALSGDIRFHLERGEITRLEKSIRKLIKGGFTWKDAFTQCALQNTLLEFSRGRIFDPIKCEEALGVTSSEYTEEMNEEIANVLLKLLESGDLDLDDIENMAVQDQPSDLVNSNKRDEIVQVHKYFDKSTGQLKRDPYLYSEDPSSEYLYLPSSEEEPEQPDESAINDRLADYLFPSERVQDSLVDDRSDFPYFQTSDDSDSSREFEDSLLSRFSDDSSEEAARDSLIDEPTFQQQYAPMEEIDMPESRSLEDDTAPSVEPYNNQGVTRVSEEDEKTLEKLLEGTIQPEDLDPRQQERMQSFIEKLIQVLENTTPAYTTAVAEDVPEEAQDADIKGVIGTEGDMVNTYDEDTYSSPSSEEEEDVEEVKKEEGGDLLGEVDKKSLHLPPKEQLLQLGVEVPETGDSEEVKDTVRGNKKIDSHRAWIMVNKGLDEPTAVLFLNNLTKIFGLPADALTYRESDGLTAKLINLYVSSDMPEGKDAEAIAKDVLSAKEAIRAQTNILVESTGVGNYDDGVEVKENNRYVVLTFILVGSIAGVMLAVVTIYLIKRHTRSKQKLAQITANPDGNEASKDYQDLCRQRMQGKSSEKPEPLHAASRIGSTSESQVRSPSSRSSTSSWSEEPAATNMDISTGHIVLSYMEDHLKNQNRLDKEWEAVSSYVADPAATKVATDQSNMRKNRFADILPYDHSRVVLSSNANVANSDYINASFITDHDPRNPAYICTQGPLPHTVADFWQMIWEQGSVVIVMLTKLTENGTGLCHRYWPEEGSDLYHIYEVHLVSEHIWCDDYLVRSFYLKNLQTNETRTVTQFHFLTWPQLSVPASIKTLLDFRRKVNKSFRGRSCPIVVHCSDGCGRSGTYCLVDMVLNKMAKGAKEIDMAATLEHIRDQRMSTVKTKEQFQFSLAAVAEEVHAILKALPQ